MKKKSKIFYYTVSGSEPLAIDLYLSIQAKSQLHVDWSRSYCKKLLEDNAISVRKDRQQLNPATLVTPGDKISVMIPLALLKKKRTGTVIKNRVDLEEAHIIWEDKDLLVASKPKGMPSQQTLDPARDYFLQSVHRLLEQRGEKKIYLVLHHRLDVETSGLMLFCKKKSLNKAVSDLFSQRKIKKTYHALCHGNAVINQEWDHKNYLAKTSDKKLKMHAVHSGGDFAHTSFKVLKKIEDKLLIACSPHTGRTHQIRVHLAELGFPIMNDPVYGEVEDDRLLQLHAVSLEFTHPVTGQKIYLEDTFCNPVGN